MTPHQLAAENFATVSLLRWRFDKKRILGGALGARCCHLAEYRHRVADAPIFYVVIGEEDCVIAEGHAKADALSRARAALASPSIDEYVREFERLSYEDTKRIGSMLMAMELGVGMRTEESGRSAPSIPRRRRAIFDASGGRCHYCSTPLRLTGKWHIEHKMPRALMGSNEPTNLVASCVPCNLKKRDRTDVEFIAMQKGAAA